MILEIGILLTSYIGIRISEKYNHKKKSTSLKQIKPKALKKQSKEIVVNNVEKQHQHYLKFSVVSMGLGALRQFVHPVLAPIFYPNLVLLSFCFYLYTTLPYMRQVEKTLIKQRKVDVDVFFFTADMITLGINQYFVAASTTLLYHHGQYMVKKLKNDSENRLINVFNQQSHSVWMLKDNVEIEVPLEKIKVNDIIVVQTGERVPVDGLIIEGMATIDQHALTGESQPVEKEVGTQVFASTFLVTGKIYVKVEKAGQDTTIAQIGQILIDSADFKSQIQLKGEQWANKATFPMLVLSGFLLPILGPTNTVVFMYSHIGNRIRVLAPLGTLSHISLASHKGILIKDGRVLEELSKVDTILFDKTGTLTHEEPDIRQIIVCNNYQEEEILTYAAAAECKLTHPIAKAILKKAKDAGITLPKIEDSKYQLGYGITVNLDDKVIRVGSVRFLSQEKIVFSETLKTAIEQSQKNGYSIVVVAVNHQAVGVIELQTSVRTEIKPIMTGLRQQGIKFMAIVSGDHQQPTQKLAEDLGMDSYFYEVLPQHKAEIVEQLQKEGKSVCFIGDGINDTIAMKKANVSISLQGATSIATDTAEIVLMDGSLSHLVQLFDLSKRLEANLQKSLALTLAPGISSLSSAFFLHFNIMTSLLIIMIFVSLGIRNAVLPLREIKE
ncbi:MAG: heavy metal translocating P-type ATPase [Candidatus Parabeggiatoa sp.]|nr:heavy metal translocating P-type ATPase [Candidatus Parabeggiatoa sp.]